MCYDYCTEDLDRGLSPNMATCSLASAKLLVGFTLEAQVLLAAGLPAAMAEATDILLNQILQELIVKRGPVVLLASMQVFLRHIFIKAEGRRES